MTISRFSSLRGCSLQHFILLWSGAIGIAFLLLSVASVLALNRLDYTAQDAIKHGEHLERMETFETATLGANRRFDANWSRSDSLLRQLQQRYSTDSKPLETAYRALKTNFDARAPWSDEHPFLDAMRNYRRAEFVHIAGESKQSTQLSKFSRWAVFILLALALTGLAVGGVKLWSRVFVPLLVIERVAKRFGTGDLSVRVPITRADEIGALSATWNAMATAIGTREAERLRFVAAVAHDLKSPLMFVGMAAAMLRDKPNKFSSVEHANWLDKMVRNVRRTEAMIADLTDAVQSQTGTLQLRCEDFDLAVIARACIDETALVFPGRALIFQGETTLEIHGDRDRLERAIANLLSNAAKYSAPTTEIVVALERRAHHAILEVRDQGVGITPTDLKRLFMPFVRLERTEKMASGTGLGLATTKKIIEAHSGQLEVESEIGSGSTFRLIVLLKQVERKVTVPLPTQCIL